DRRPPGQGRERLHPSGSGPIDLHPRGCAASIVPRRLHVLWGAVRPVGSNRERSPSRPRSRGRQELPAASEESQKMTAAKKISGTAAFQPRARLLKLIGAELISDDVVAVTEFVKNAYDADASNVTIRFENVSDVGGTII